MHYDIIMKEIVKRAYNNCKVHCVIFKMKAYKVDKKKRRKKKAFVRETF